MIGRQSNAPTEDERRTAAARFYGPPLEDPEAEAVRSSAQKERYESVAAFVQKALYRRNKQPQSSSQSHTSLNHTELTPFLVIHINASFYALEMHNIPHEQGTLFPPKMSGQARPKVSGLTRGKRAFAYFDLPLQREHAELVCEWKAVHEELQSQKGADSHVPRDIAARSWYEPFTHKSHPPLQKCPSHLPVCGFGMFCRLLHLLVSWEYVGDGSMNRPRKWISLEDAVATTSTNQVRVMGFPISDRSDYVERVEEARNRMCFVIMEFEAQHRRERLLMINDMISRAAESCKRYHIINALEQIAERVKDQRSVDGSWGVSALQGIVSNDAVSHEFGQALWPYLEREKSYPMMLACKALRAFGVEHDRHNKLKVIGIMHRANPRHTPMPNGEFPFHRQGPDGEYIIRAGTNIRFQLTVYADPMQRVVIPADAGRNEEEVLRKDVHVYEKMGSSVYTCFSTTLAANDHANSQRVGLKQWTSLIDVELVNDDEKRTRAGRPHVDASELFLRKAWNSAFKPRHSSLFLQTHFLHTAHVRTIRSRPLPTKKCR